MYIDWLYERLLGAAGGIMEYKDGLVHDRVA